MINIKYPRSPKALLGGIAHLGRFIGRIKGVGSLFLTRVSGIDTRTVCPAAPALQLEILRIMS